MAEFLGLDELFEGRHFDREVIVLCVRWYLRFKLSYRDLVEMMAERDLPLAHTTIMRWVHHYAPEFVSTFCTVVPSRLAVARKTSSLSPVGALRRRLKSGFTSARFAS